MKILSFILPHTVSKKAKRRIQKGCLEKNKAHWIFRKTNISYPLIRTRVLYSLKTSENLQVFWRFQGVQKSCGYQGKKCSFFKKFGVLYFLETPVLKFTHYLITDDIMPMFHPYTSWKRRETRVLLTFSGSIKMNVKWVEVSSIL